MNKIEKLKKNPLLNREGCWIGEYYPSTQEIMDKINEIIDKINGEEIMEE